MEKGDELEREDVLLIACGAIPSSADGPWVCSDDVRVRDLYFGRGWYSWSKFIDGMDIRALRGARAGC